MALSTGGIGIYLSSELNPADISKIQSQIKALQSSINKNPINPFGNATGISNSKKIFDQYGNILKDVEKKTESLGATTHTATKKTAEGIKEANLQTRMFGQGLGDVLKKIAIWTALTGVVFGTIRALKEGVQAVVDLDTALVELRKVTNLSDGALVSFTKQAMDAGNAVARTTQEMVNASAIFARMGFSPSDSLALAEQAALFTNVGDGVDDVIMASNTMISALKGFNMEVSQSIDIIDKLNNVSNNFAVTVGDLSEGITRVSASLNVAGNTLDQSIAMITAGTEILRDPARVATGLRTIAMRLRGVGEEGEDLSELIPKLEKQFSAIGVALTDTNGNFRSTYDILLDVAGAWNNLTDMQKAQINELAAGKRQSDVFTSVILNQKTLVDALTTSLDAQGSAMRENAHYMDSVQAKAKLFTKAVEDMWIKAINSNTIKGLVDFGTSIIKVIDALGIGNVVITTLITAIIRLKGTEIIKWFSTLSGQIYALGGGLKGFLSGIGGALKGVGITAAIAAATYVITSLVDTISRSINAFRDFRKELGETVTKFSDNKREVNSLLSSLKDVTAGSEEYYEITNRINQLMPSFVSNVDEKGNAHLKNAEAIDLEISRLERLEELYNSNREAISISEIQDSFSDFSKKYADSLRGAGFEQMFGTTSSEIVEALIISLMSDAEVAAEQTAQTLATALNSKIPEEFSGLDLGYKIASMFTEQFQQGLTREAVLEAGSFLGIRSGALGDALGQIGFGDVNTAKINETAFAITEVITKITTLNQAYADGKIKNSEYNAAHKFLDQAIRMLTGGTITYDDVLNHLIDTQNESIDATEDATAANENLARSLSDILSDDKFASSVKGWIDVINDWRSSTEDVEDAVNSLASSIGVDTETITSNMDLISAYAKGNEKAFYDALVAQMKLFGLKPSVGGIVGAVKTITNAMNNGSVEAWKLINFLARLGTVKITYKTVSYMGLASRIPIVTMGNTTVKPPSPSGGGGGGSSSSPSTEKEETYIDKLKNLLSMQIHNIDLKIDKEKELLDTLKEQYKVEDMILKLQEAQIRLQNVIDERNVRLYNPDTNKFEWVSDPRELREAQKALKDAEVEYERYLEEKALQDKIDALEKEKKLLSDFNKAISELTKQGVNEQVKTWDQLIKKLKEVGIAFDDASGSIDFSKIDGSGGGGGSNSKASAISAALKKGSKGTSVKILQRALAALGYSVGTIDGIFGNKTLAALRKFQADNGIATTGRLDSNTKTKFAAKGYEKGGAVDYTGIAEVHGSKSNPEYMYSAPDVKIMSQLPSLITNLLKGNAGSNGGFNIENMTVVANSPNDFMKQMKNYAALGNLVPRRG